MKISRKLAAAAAFFMVAAVIAGCGSSSNSIPQGSAASVAGNPISVSAVDHWMYIAAKQEAATLAQEGETTPVITAPDPPNFADCIKQVRASIATLAKTPAKTLRADCQRVFAEYMPQVMDYLIEGYWYQADAHKLGVTYSTKAENKALAAVVKEFKSKTAYLLYLKSSGETQQDIAFQLRVNGVYGKLVTRYQKPVTSKAVAAYYKSHASQYATPSTVSGHLIRVKTAAGATAAAAALKSGTSWAVVAKQYSEDATSKADAGAITSVAPNTYETAVNSVLFKSPLDTVEGPVKGVFGYYVVELTRKTAAVQKSLAQETSTIKALLTQNAQTAAKSKITSISKAYWGKETLCRSRYSSPDCTGYKAPVTTTTPAATTTPATSTTASTSTGASTLAGGSSTTASSTARSTGTSTKAANSTTTSG